MNKSDLIDAIASHANLTKADVGRALEGITHSIQAALKAGDSVAMVGFGSRGIVHGHHRAVHLTGGDQQIDVTSQSHRTRGCFAAID